MLLNSALPNFPKHIRDLSTRTVKVAYSRHAYQAAMADRYGKINLPENINFSGKNVFEVEVENNRIVKMCIRVAYNNQYDLCLAILTENSLVKTVWLNAKNDNHSTLKKENYA